MRTTTTSCVEEIHSSKLNSHNVVLWCCVGSSDCCLKKNKFLNLGQTLKQITKNI